MLHLLLVKIVKYLQCLITIVFFLKIQNEIEKFDFYFGNLCVYFLYSLKYKFTIAIQLENYIKLNHMVSSSLF